MLDYLKRFLIAGIMALCVSLLFFGSKPQASSLDKMNDWIWPTDGIISDTYGTRFGAHKGIDIAGSVNNPIFAVDAGKVTKSYYSDTYGHVVFIKHDNNLETVYAHLNIRLVKEGQQVKKAEIIGRMGNTGNSNGVHLHFEVHENEWTFEKENALNPTVVLGEVVVGNFVQALGEENAQYVVKNIQSTPQELNEQTNGFNPKVHIVSAGESLWSIAQKYSTTIETIQSINSLATTQIFENQKLVLPEDSKDIYVVQNGDTLTAISKKTKRSVEEIKNFNQLQTDDIYPLQIINIPMK
jgi:LysM repeat protein